VNLKSVLKTIGVGLLASNPVGAGVLSVVNAFLPDDEKLDAGVATGADVHSAIDKLPADVRERLMQAEINLEVEQERGRTARYQAMCSADGQQTRAKIVQMAMWSLIGLTMVFMLFVGFVYVEKGAAEAFSAEMVAFFFALSGTYAYVIRAYFGDLKAETQSRHATIDDKPQHPKGLAGLFSAIRG